MKGGSIASDSVISNLDVKVFDKLNAMFDNKIGGGKVAKRGGGCGCDKKTVLRKGGSAFGSMMGSTMEAFQGNVRSMPHEMFAGPNAGVMVAASATNAGKNAAIKGVKSNATSNVKPTNVKVLPPATNAKATNSGIKSNSTVAAVKSNTAAMNSGVKAPTTTGGSRSKVSIKKGGNASKFPTAAYSGEGGRCSKCGHLHKGGNQSASIPIYPSNTSIANANSGMTMSQLMSNSRGVNIKHKKLHGGKDISIGPNLNIWDVPSTSRPQMHSSANDVLASEGVSSSPQIQKFMNYGSPSEKFPQPFSYGQASTGGAKAWKKKVTKKVKALRRKRV
jgi:hypothetical protein